MQTKEVELQGEKFTVSDHVASFYESMNELIERAKEWLTADARAQLDESDTKAWDKAEEADEAFCNAAMSYFREYLYWFLMYGYGGGFDDTMLGLATLFAGPNYKVEFK